MDKIFNDHIWIKNSYLTSHLVNHYFEDKALHLQQIKILLVLLFIFILYE